MFTGLVQGRGRIAGIETKPFGKKLIVEHKGWTPQPRPFGPGDSVCVSGVCLTVVEAHGGTVHFDVVAETLARTTLGRLQVGSELNLEPALTAMSPIGGHFVQGHVEGIGQITHIQQVQDDQRLRIEPVPGGAVAPVIQGGLMQAVVPKGSVTVDGVSLTVASVMQDGKAFEVALIPTTLQMTTLGQAKQGDWVNLETDIISRTVVYWLNKQFKAGEVRLEGISRGTPGGLSRAEGGGSSGK